jgi:hypothetical protein
MLKGKARRFNLAPSLQVRIEGKNEMPCSFAIPLTHPLPPIPPHHYSEENWDYST